MTIVVFIILATFVALLVGMQVIKFVKYQRGVNNAPLFPVVCAGSEKPWASKDIKVTNLDWGKFFDKDNNPVNPDNFLKFITRGNSMLLGGIKDGDLVLVEEKKDGIIYPAFVVLKREPQAIANAHRVNDYAELKIRRAWNECDLGKTDDDILSIIREIIEGNKTFNELKQLDSTKFPSEEWLICDFSERLKRYREEHEGCESNSNEHFTAIISTTLDTFKNRVHFSIHSKQMLIGVVKHAYGIQ